MVKRLSSQRWNMVLNALIHETTWVGVKRQLSQTSDFLPSCVPETQRTSGRQCRKFQGGKKNFSLVHWEQMFYRNSSALANFCQSTGNFHQKPTDFLAAHLMPFGKTALPGSTAGDGRCAQTVPEQQLPIHGLQLLHSWAGTFWFAGSNSGSRKEAQRAKWGGS